MPARSEASQAFVAFPHIDIGSLQTAQHVHGDRLEARKSRPADRSIGPAYRTLSDTRSADDTLRSKRQRDFAEVTPQFDECEVVLRECKRTLSRREDTIEKLGEIQ